ncbi:TetR/AcrR family transcriptional regulator [Mycobacterium sp. AZCC_0083]|uniref:TetR/AcrR family transcriptional regulator n=1 Tax=Mycobacterium sp. AZCC_0083 TaxID=2735882 RepID=UPI00160963EC|nr:TetR/AcrR family transcriptional regulator [Mycobacterium sp. AZCC_0083]MBB5164961.1 AcrR family transcriptional regulator [Mycobacterium sp. AZCC_0083]
MPQTPPADPRSWLELLVHPPLRADARRNYEALLASADELFTTDGPDASLDKIARRAGVGNATLYRHFPDRRDLLVAVCVGDVRALCKLGDQLHADPDADQAFSGWLRAYIDHVGAKHGLAAAFATGRRDDSELVAACQAAVAAIGSSLLRRAQDGGAVRTDVTLPDVVTLVNAIAMATESRAAGEADRMLAIVLAGIASR